MIGRTIDCMDLVDLGYAQIYFEEPIIRFVFKEGAQLGFPEIRELTAHAERLSNGRPYLSLSDIRVDIDVTPEGRRVAADARLHPLNRATAFLVRDKGFKIVATPFSSLGKLNYPYKIFTNEEKARQWLLKHPVYQYNLTF